MALKTGPKGLALIKESEGYMTALPDGGCQAYLDKSANPKAWSKGYKGLWTIGYGSTGPDVTKGTVWTKAKAEAELCAQNGKLAKVHEAPLNAKLKALGITLNQNQYDALISASWNLGSETSLIQHALQAVKNGKPYDFAALFKQYNHAGSKVLPGLTTRRKREAALFNTVPDVAVADNTFSASPVLAPSIDEMINAGELASQSRKVSLLLKVRNWMGLGAVGGTTLSLADVDDGASHVHNIMQTFKAEAWLMVLGVFVAGAVIAAVLIVWIIEDHKSGRYQPSKGA